MAYVEELGDKKHKIYVDMGYVNGKRVRRTKTVTVTSDRDLNKKIREFELKCMQEADEPIDNISFAGFADKWMKNHVDVNLKFSTKRKYIEALESDLMNHFGKMKLKNIKKYHIVEYFAKNEGKGLLPNKLIVLKSIFAKAVEWDILKSNPTDKIKKPNPKTKRKIDFYTEEEITHLMGVLDNVYPKHRIMIKLAVIGGLRRGEIAGIREESINFEKNYIYIDKQLSYDRNTQSFYMSSVKNNKPRYVYFPSDFMNELKTYVVNLKSKKMQMGNQWKPFKEKGETVNLIIVKENGFPAVLNSITWEWGKIKKRYNLKDITFHQLRHSCASYMVKKGVNFKVIQERLGHSNIGITLDLYSHLEENQHIESAKMFNDIL